MPKSRFPGLIIIVSAGLLIDYIFFEGRDEIYEGAVKWLDEKGHALAEYLHSVGGAKTEVSLK